MKLRIKIPSPLAIALALTVFVLITAILFAKADDVTYLNQAEKVLEYWYNGFWSLLAFTMQMIMILVLGHMIALSIDINNWISRFMSQFTNMHFAILGISLCTLLLSWFNWGLGLIVGAVLARKLGEYASINKLEINYPLAGAAGYSGFMVWHGGISGSATMKVAEDNHFLVDKIGVISAGETVFSTMNLVAFALALVLVPLFIYWLSKKSKPTNLDANDFSKPNQNGLDKVFKVNYLVLFVGLLIIVYSFYKMLNNAIATNDVFAVLNLNYLNFLLFGIALIFIRNIGNLQLALDEASTSASGILIQFPLYAGIMGVMKDSGMIAVLADAFLSVSNNYTFPIYTLFSAAIVNLFVPSGGGQWAVQGPLVVEAAQKLGVPIAKSIMALVYGDQLSNMIQPFWALPLLGITKIKAAELLPFTFKIMLLGFLIFICVLLF